MKFLALLNKDLKSEFRTKVAISSLALFVFISIILIYFQVQTTEISTKILSSLYWIIYFFAAISGFAVNLLKEEDKGTSIFLNISMNPVDIWLGKLSYNLMLSVIVNILEIMLFSLLISDFNIVHFSEMIFGNILSGIAIASSVTTLSAMLAKGGGKSFVLPVLALPILLPSIIVASNITNYALGGVVSSSAESGLIIQGYYIAVVNAATWMLFDIIWRD